MKNLIFKNVALILITLLFSSCAALHNGYMANSASLNSANFSYLNQNVKGESSASYFLCLGGNKIQSIVAEAKKDLTNKNKLDKNQALANITVDYRYSTFLGIFSTVKCTVTADIVEFK